LPRPRQELSTTSIKELLESILDITHSIDLCCYITCDSVLIVIVSVDSIVENVHGFSRPPCYRGDRVLSSPRTMAYINLDCRTHHYIDSMAPVLVLLLERRCVVEHKKVCRKRSWSCCHVAKVKICTLCAWYFHVSFDDYIIRKRHLARFSEKAIVCVSKARAVSFSFPRNSSPLSTRFLDFFA